LISAGADAATADTAIADTAIKQRRHDRAP